MSAQLTAVLGRSRPLTFLLLVGLLGGAWSLGYWWPADVRAVARQWADPIVLYRVEAFAEELRLAGAESDLDPNLLAALVYSESSGRTAAVSKANALGLMQLLPPAAEDSSKRLKLAIPTSEQLLEDSLLNLRLGASHFAWTLRHEEQDVERALVAYNAGRTKLRRWIRAAGSYSAWLQQQRVAGDSGVLAYAERVMSYAEVFRERGRITPGP
jgi:soluble lytic murein transglycosylase-like protein